MIERQSELAFANDPMLMINVTRYCVTINHEIGSLKKCQIHFEHLFMNIQQERILAPVRTHTRITPTVRRIEPELYVNKVPVDVPVPNPVPVEKIVVTQKHVPRPYTVEVPQPYAVPQPYKVHPVQQVVETPVVEETSYTVHQPIATAVHAAPAVAHGYAAAAPAVAHGYAAAEPAYAAQGYAAQGYAGQGYAAQGYAGAAQGYVH